MKPDRTTDDVPQRDPPAADLSPTAKVRQLRAVSRPYAWDPYEVWRTRVKPRPDTRDRKD
jgi:hypothetical protein